MSQRTSSHRTKRSEGDGDYLDRGRSTELRERDERSHAVQTAAEIRLRCRDDVQEGDKASGLAVPLLLCYDALTL